MIGTSWKSGCDFCQSLHPSIHLTLVILPASYLMYRNILPGKKYKGAREVKVIMNHISILAANQVLRLIHSTRQFLDKTSFRRRTKIWTCLIVLYVLVCQTDSDSFNLERYDDTMLPRMRISSLPRTFFISSPSSIQLPFIIFTKGWQLW